MGRNDSVGRSETMNVWSQSTTVNPQSTIASHVQEELQGAEETPHTVHSSTRSSPKTPHRPPRVPRSSPRVGRSGPSLDRLLGWDGSTPFQLLWSDDVRGPSLVRLLGSARVGPFHRLGSGGSRVGVLCPRSHSPSRLHSSNETGGLGFSNLP